MLLNVLRGGKQNHPLLRITTSITPYQHRLGTCLARRLFAFVFRLSRKGTWGELPSGHDNDHWPNNGLFYRLNPQSQADCQTFDADFQHFLGQHIQVICQNYEMMGVRPKPAVDSVHTSQQHGILKSSGIDMPVVGCLLYMRSKFRKLHV